MSKGFQFFREECFSRVRAQGAPSTRTGKPARSRRPPGRLSAMDIIAEAARYAGATPHVAAPQPPRVLYGLGPDDLQVWYARLCVLADAQRTPVGNRLRKQRVDTPILLGAVASFPQPANESNCAYVEWRDRTLAFFRQRYGANLVCVLEHVDEAHGHLHALVANQGASVKPLHAGHAAAMKLTGPKPRSQAYKAAERGLQDEFHVQVAGPCGLARVGPRRRRLTRAEWQIDQVARRTAKAQADAIADAQWALAVDRQQLETERRALAEFLQRAIEHLPLDLVRQATALVVRQPIAPAATSPMGVSDVDRPRPGPATASQSPLRG
jgi:hypothetical protein